MLALQGPDLEVPRRVLDVRSEHDGCGQQRPRARSAGWTFPASRRGREGLLLVAILIVAALPMQLCWLFC